MGRFGQTAAVMPAQEALDRLAAWHAALSLEGWKIATQAAGKVIPCAVRLAHAQKIKTYMAAASAVFAQIAAAGAPYPSQKVFDMDGKFVKTVTGALPIAPLTFTISDCQQMNGGFGVVPVAVAAVLAGAFVVSIIAVGKAIALRIAGPAVPVDYAAVVDAYTTCTKARAAAGVSDAAGECRALVFGVRTAPEAPWTTWLFGLVIVAGLVGGGVYVYRRNIAGLKRYVAAA